MDTTVTIEMDLCVLCGKETQYPKSLPVDMRENYIEGAGQLCNQCGVKTDNILNDGKKEIQADRSSD